MGYDTPCHVWTGNLTGARRGAEKGRYGKLYIHGRYHVAHRYIYEREVGPIPAEKYLHHRCHITACVNPLHLEPTTARENNRLKKNTKLTSADIPLIRASKLSSEDLAQILNVSPSLIYQVRSGDAWDDSE